MSNNFTVVEGNKESEKENINMVMRAIALYDCWERQYKTAIYNAMTRNRSKNVADYPQEDLMKIGFTGIKYMMAVREVYRANMRVGTDYEHTLEESKCIFQMMDAIFTICGHMTLRNFVITFPIKKDFDGHKWECKDYFYTMEVLAAMDWDKPIGREEVSKLIWDYENDDLRKAYVEYMCATSTIYRSQTGKGMLEQFCEDNGIGTYTVNEGLGLIKDNQTGKISKLKNTPSHIRVLK